MCSIQNIIIARITPVPIITHNGKHMVKKFTSFDGKQITGGNCKDEYCDTDTNIMGARPHRAKAPVTSVTCKTILVLFLSSFLDQIGRIIFMNKCIKCSIQNAPSSTNPQWKTTPKIRKIL